MAIGTVQLQLVDAGGKPLVDPSILIDLTCTEIAKHFRVQTAATGSELINIQLNEPGNGIYHCLLMPTHYRAVSFFLRVTEGETATRTPVRFPVNPDKVVDIDAPLFQKLPQDLQEFLSQASLDGLGNAKKGLQGASLYKALPPLLKAALLNLYLKSAKTLLPDKDPVFKLLGSMIKLHQDRLFARIKADLLEEAMISPNFHQVDFSLHETVPPYRLFDSYKTRDPFGNLQLTFSRNGTTGNDYLVDMDIDEAQGIEHAFEVIHNAVTQQLTNPYSVRDILLADQQLEPLYSLRFGESGTVSVASAAG